MHSPLHRFQYFGSKWQSFRFLEIFPPLLTMDRMGIISEIYRKWEAATKLLLCMRAYAWYVCGYFSQWGRQAFFRRYWLRLLLLLSVSSSHSLVQESRSRRYKPSHFWRQTRSRQKKHIRCKVAFLSYQPVLGNNHRVRNRMRDLHRKHQ